MFLVIMNGRYLGGRVQAAPAACLNDGLLDITMHHGPAGTKELLAFIKTGLVQKGAHIYRDNYACMRGKSLRITNRIAGPAAARGLRSDADFLGMAD